MVIRLARCRQTVEVRLIRNVLWFISGSGFVLAIGYGVAALIRFALIVSGPFGIAHSLGRLIVDIETPRAEELSWR